MSNKKSTHWTKEQLEKLTATGRVKIVDQKLLPSSFHQGNIRLDVEVMGAVRQTRADAWKKRPVVLRYWEAKDKLLQEVKDKKAEGVINRIAHTGIFRADIYHVMPKSWSKKKRAEMALKPMREKPDWDNVGKMICDALFEEDKAIWDGRVVQYWADVDDKPFVILYDPQREFTQNLKA